MYSIYAHINKKNGHIYIGQTKQNVYDRWDEGKNYSQGKFKDEIDKYGWDSFEHKELIAELTQNEANAFEAELIRNYTLKGISLNTQKGNHYDGHFEYKKYGKKGILMTLYNGNSTCRRYFALEKRSNGITYLSQSSTEYLNKKEMVNEDWHQIVKQWWKRGGCTLAWTLSQASEEYSKKFKENGIDISSIKIRNYLKKTLFFQK